MMWVLVGVFSCWVKLLFIKRFEMVWDLLDFCWLFSVEGVVWWFFFGRNVDNDCLRICVFMNVSVIEWYKILLCLVVFRSCFLLCGVSWLLIKRWINLLCELVFMGLFVNWLYDLEVGEVGLLCGECGC